MNSRGRARTMRIGIGRRRWDCICSVMLALWLTFSGLG
jgi:hypothetical protein